MNVLHSGYVFIEACLVVAALGRPEAHEPLQLVLLCIVVRRMLATVAFPACLQRLSSLLHHCYGRVRCTLHLYFPTGQVAVLVVQVFHEPNLEVLAIA